MGTDREDDEVELVRVSGRFAADPILAALRANGIAARSRGEALGKVYGLTMDGIGEVTILVLRSQLEAARELLKAADRGDLRLDDSSRNNKKSGDQDRS